MFRRITIVFLRVGITCKHISLFRKNQVRLAEAGSGGEAGRRLAELESGQLRLEDSVRTLAAKLDLILSKL